MQSPQNNNDAPEQEIEDIPDADLVSRCCYAVNGVHLDPATNLQFSSQNNPPRCESVYWRRYAPTPNDVAVRGRRIMELGNKRRVAKGQDPMEYVGARTGNAGAIRMIRTERGFAFSVEHLPEVDDKAHTHVTLIKIDPDGPDPKRADKSELVAALLAAMPFEAYI